MNKALIIARWEFLAAVTRRAYLFAVIGMPLLFTVIGAIPVLSSRSAAMSSATVPVALVDPAGIVDVDFAIAQAERREARQPGSRLEPPPVRPAGLVAYRELEPALTDLRARKVSAVYAIDRDYLATGTITTYVRDAGFSSQAFGSSRQALVGDAIRASLLKSALSGETLDRAYAPMVNMKRLAVDTAGNVKDNSSLGLGPFAGSFVVLLLFTMSIFFSAGFLQQGTVEDRQNRVFEILLSSATAEELLIGKILGLGAAGLLQVVLYVALILVPGTAVLSLFEISATMVLLSFVYFIVGYLLFACLMGAIGMIGRTQQETAQLSAFWTLTAVSPLWFMMAISAAPNGALARALSFFPLTSPVTMILRLSTGEVPAIDIVLSIAIGVAAIYVALRAAAKIFRAATLMYGKRPTLPELVRWLRTA